MHRAMPVVVREFVRRGIVADSGHERFRAAVTSALRWRDSTVAEIVLLAVVYGAGIAAVWHYEVALRVGRIFFAGASLPEHWCDIALVLVFGLALVLGPMLALSPALFGAKKEGLLRYGALAERYVRDFDAKWVSGQGQGDEALLGAADIQSLADLGNSFGTVKNMQLVAFTTEGIVLLAAATLAPVAPLVLTMIPAGELFDRLAKLLL